MLAKLKPLLEDPGVLKIGHNLKYDWVMLHRLGIDVAPVDDTMVMSFDLDAGRSFGHGLEELAKITGGRFLPLSRFREAADLLPDRSRTQEKVTELGWKDHPLAVALVLLSLLSLEWILRKRADLV